MQQYDVMIIGAGIAGSSCAYFLKEKGLKVLVLDRSGIATSGGSAAAGAFVSPKIGKGSPLQTLTNEAFEFSKAFYLEKFPEHFAQTGVIRIPKDTQDAEQFMEYEKFNAAKRELLDETLLQNLGIQKSKSSFLFNEAGVCDAQSLCQSLMEGIDFVKYDVKSLQYENSFWQLEKYASKHLILATGYENRFFDMRYMGIKGTWGTRGDYKSSLDLGVSLHKKISVSGNIKGLIKVGATHEKEIDSCVDCSEEPLQDLFNEASSMVDTSDFELKDVFCGMRAGSKDYFPLIGPVIDTQEMLKKYPKLVRGEKLSENYTRVENLYVCNGLGGRGFVFAPLMAKMLSEHIVEGKAIDKHVHPDRLFLKWCRKSPELER